MDDRPFDQNSLKENISERRAGGRKGGGGREWEMLFFVEIPPLWSSQVRAGGLATPAPLQPLSLRPPP